MKKTTSLIFLILIGSSITTALYFIYKNSAYQAYERSMVRLSVSILRTSQDSHLYEFKIFEVDKMELKKLVRPLDEVSIYYDIEDIEPSIKKKINSADWPYLSENRFKVILILDSRQYKKRSVWVYGNETEPKKILEDEVFEF